MSVARALLLRASRSKWLADQFRKRTFAKRPVEVGTTLYDYAAITGGLRENEYVAAKHTFVLEVARRAAPGAGR